MGARYKVKKNIQRRKESWGRCSQERTTLEEKGVHTSPRAWTTGLLRGNGEKKNGGAENNLPHLKKEKEKKVRNTHT